jgi:hypothetical protein
MQCKLQKLCAEMCVHVSQGLCPVVPFFCAFDNFVRFMALRVVSFIRSLVRWQIVREYVYVWVWVCAYV